MQFNRPAFLILALFSSLNTSAQMHYEFHQMAKLSKEQLDYKGAVKMMKKAIELAPEEVNYYVERGHLYLGMEKNKKALADFKTAMKLDSMNVEPWIGKSLCHMYNNELDSALMVAHIASILAESQYEKARAGSLLGEISVNNQEETKAFNYFSGSLQLDTTNNRGYKKAAQIAMNRQNFEQAERLLLKAYTNDAQDLEILINLAYTYNNLEYFRQSLEFCNMALTYDSSQPLARSNRAFAYFQLGENERALDDINLSIRNDKSNPTAYKHKGEILLTMEDETDKACKCFDKAVKLGYDQEKNKDLEELVAIHCSKEKND